MQRVGILRKNEVHAHATLSNIWPVVSLDAKNFEATKRLSQVANILFVYILNVCADFSSKIGSTRAHVGVKRFRISFERTCHVGVDYCQIGHGVVTAWTTSSGVTSTVITHIRRNKILSRERLRQITCGFNCALEIRQICTFF